MRASVLVKALVGLAVLVEVAAFSGLTWLDHGATLRRTADDLGRIAVLMEEHTRATLQTDRLVLRQFAGLLPDGDLSEWRGGEVERARLTALMRDVPELQSLWLLDAAGRVALSSVAGVQDTYYADRDYFRHHVETPDSGTYVSPMIWGRVTGGFLFAVSQAVRDADGSLRAVVEASIDSGHFTSFYGRISPSDGSVFGVYRPDGQVVMRVPLPVPGPAGEGLRIGGDTVGRILEQPVGTFRAESRIDGVDRLYSYRKLDDLPLIVATGRPMTEIFGAWRARAERNAMLALGSALVILLLGAAVLRSLGREARSADALVVAHANEVRARAEAQKAATAKSRFLAAASHDLRQPFQAMRLYFELIRNGEVDPALHPALTGMERAISAGQRLLHSLLDISRLDSGQVLPKTECGPIQPILDDLAGACGPLAAEKGLRLRVLGCAAHVESDPALLAQVLHNLTGNAVKYTERGRVLVGCRRRGASLVIEVWDTGIGVAADALDAIFDEFVQLDNEERDSEKGYGLGLSVVKRTVDLLGHTLQVRSVPGKGSVFSIAVPLAPPPKPAAPAPLESQTAA